MERVASYLLTAGVDFEFAEGDRLPTDLPDDCSRYKVVVCVLEDIPRLRARLDQFEGIERIDQAIEFRNPMKDVARDARWPWLHFKHRRSECRLVPLRDAELDDERRLDSRILWVGALTPDNPNAAKRLQARPDDALFEMASRALLSVDPVTLSAWNDSTFLAWKILLESFQRTGRREFLQAILDQASVAMREGLPAVCSQDDIAPCGPLLLVARHLGDARLREFALQRLRAYVDGPRHRGAFTCYLGDQWVRTDAMGIALPAVTICANATGDASLFDGVYRSFEVMREELLQNEGPLWSQGVFRGQVAAPWARGMAWAVFGLSIVLEYWPERDPRWRAMADSFRELCEGFLPWQEGDGFWHQVLDEPQSARETSATYLVTRSFLWGTREGVLPASFTEPARRGWLALKTRCFQGLMTGVVEATSVSTRRQYYRERHLNSDPKHLRLTSRFVLDVVNQLA